MVTSDFDFNSSPVYSFIISFMKVLSGINGYLKENRASSEFIEKAVPSGGFSIANTV
jgi:hypothetical protein